MRYLSPCRKQRLKIHSGEARWVKPVGKNDIAQQVVERDFCTDLNHDFRCRFEAESPVLVVEGAERGPRVDSSEESDSTMVFPQVTSEFQQCRNPEHSTLFYRNVVNRADVNVWFVEGTTRMDFGSTARTYS